MMDVQAALMMLRNHCEETHCDPEVLAVISNAVKGYHELSIVANNYGLMMRDGSKTRWLSFSPWDGERWFGYEDKRKKMNSAPDAEWGDDAEHAAAWLYGGEPSGEWEYQRIYETWQRIRAEQAGVEPDAEVIDGEAKHVPVDNGDTPSKALAGAEPATRGE